MLEAHLCKRTLLAVTVIAATCVLCLFIPETLCGQRGIPSKEAARRAYLFGYNNEVCDPEKVSGEKSDPTLRAVEMYADICKEGIDDFEKGKPPNPEQAGNTELEIRAREALNQEKYVEAFSLFKREAGARRTKSQLILGMMYKDGIGCERNCGEALKWLTKAAEGHSEDAMYNLGVMYMKGECVEADFAKAETFFMKASNYLHAGALTNLGVMVINGKIKGNPVLAYIYWRTASEMGDVYAGELLEKYPFTAEQKELGEKALMEADEAYRKETRQDRR